MRFPLRSASEGEHMAGTGGVASIVMPPHRGAFRSRLYRESKTEHAVWMTGFVRRFLRSIVDRPATARRPCRGGWFRALDPLLAAVLLINAAVQAAETHPFGVRDLVNFDRLSDPRVSPDGQRVVFTVSALALDANKRRTDLWLVGARGDGLRRLTTHEAGNSSGRWSPDGHFIWFLSTRSGTQQVWKIPSDGGEALPVTQLPLEVGSFTLSRDGSLLALSLEVFPDGDSIDDTKRRLDQIKDQKSSGRIYERLPFRHWDAWGDGRRSHLFVRPATGGVARDIMKGMDTDSPSQPDGGDEEYSFTPDGRSLIFTAKNAGRDEMWSTDFNLWLAPVDGSSPPRPLTQNPAWDTQPCFAPDGKTLAYLAMKRAGYESDRYRIVVRAWPNGQDRVLTEAWDRSPATIAWAPDGKEIWATAENLGQQSVFAVDAASGSARSLVEKGTITAVCPLGDRVCVIRDTLTAPAELYSVRLAGDEWTPLTRFNQARLDRVRMGEPGQFTFSGWNNEPVHGYVMKPVDFDPQRQYPVAFLIHGGPQGSFGNHFHYRWNPQVYAGAGYAVVTVDFHGSTGYGQEFTDSIRDDWGGKPLADLQKGLEAALETHPFLDGHRVAALGASYGGYMINWIAGAWTNRFRCLVSHDGNLDERAAYYMTDELWFPEWDHEGTAWGNPESYEKHNPIQLVKNWQTPILVIHGGRDFRVVDAQGMAAFTAAQRRRIPSKLLYFPDENHWVLKPQNSILWHNTVIAWLNQWTARVP